MTQRHTTTPGGTVRGALAASRLLSALALALTMALVPAQLTAQDQQLPVASVGIGELSVAAAETAAIEHRDTDGAQMLTLPSGLDELIMGRTDYVRICGSGGCIVCTGLYCRFWPW